MRAIVYGLMTSVIYCAHVQARDFCESLNVVIKTSPEKFRNIRAKEVAGYGWDTDFKIVGMEECGIQKQDDGEVNLYCSVKGDDAFSRIKKDLENCLPKWEKWESVRTDGGLRCYFFQQGRESRRSQTVVRLWQIKGRQTILDTSDVAR